MTYGVDKSGAGDAWRKAMLLDDQTYNARTLSDGVEQAFWQSLIAQKGAYAPDPYSGPIFEAVRAIMDEAAPIRSILEIGPGWGNYSLRLRACCERMTLADISRDVLDYVAGIADGQDMPMDTVHAKWEDAALARRHDMVFAYNCFYRMRDIEACLQKINDEADRLCVIGMTSGPEQPFYGRIARELGISMKYTKLDYILLTDVLYHLGIDVGCRIVPLTKRYACRDMEEAVRKAASRFRDTAYDADAVRAILEEYYIQAEDGVYYDHAFRAAILYWTPVREERLGK